MSPATRLYEFDAPPFGTLRCEATSKREAAVIAKRFRGFRDLRPVRSYRPCEACESRPCVCSTERAQ